MLEDPNDPTGPVPPDEGVNDDPLATAENTNRKPDDAKVPGDRLPENPDADGGDDEAEGGIDA